MFADMLGKDSRQRSRVDLEFIGHHHCDPRWPCLPCVPIVASGLEEQLLGRCAVDEFAFLLSELLSALEAEEILFAPDRLRRRKVLAVRIVVGIGGRITRIARPLATRPCSLWTLRLTLLARIRLVLRNVADWPMRRSASVGCRSLVEIPLSGLDIDLAILRQRQKALTLPLRDDRLRNSTVPGEGRLAQRLVRAFTVCVHRSPFTGFRTLSLENFGAPTTRIDSRGAGSPETSSRGHRPGRCRLPIGDRASGSDVQLSAAPAIIIAPRKEIGERLRRQTMAIARSAASRRQRAVQYQRRHG